MENASSQVEIQILKRILNAIGGVPSGVYSPREDTFLLLDALSNLQMAQLEVLDMGTGSGILGLYCALKGARVTAADIDESAVACVKNAARNLNLTLRAASSNLFSNIQSAFDIILFNPPYLPSNDISDRTVDGGGKGVAVMLRFLKSLPEHIKQNGCCYIVLSSQNEPDRIFAEQPNLEFAIESGKQLFFEELMVLRLWLRNDFST